MDKKPKQGGRKKGSRNKITSDVKAMILAALTQAGGQDYLLRQSTENPTAFMALIGKVLPLTIGSDPDRPVRVIQDTDKAIIERFKQQLREKS